MATKLIELEDGTLVEVEVPQEKAQEISGGFAERVNSTFDQIKPLLVKVCRPIKETWEEINKDMTIDQVEVEIGLAFELEGNLYITKSKAEANLTVKLILKSGSQSNALTK
ncbi:CU044_2847 family protein [Nostoc sp.]|uniref:CU044_2847 family protein n=1 Tax=Nostoc sp. TaxID=1180 RepID=UPI002FFD3168